LYISIPPKPQFTGFASRLLSADLRADMRAGRIFRFRGTDRRRFFAEQKTRPQKLRLLRACRVVFFIEKRRFSRQFFAYTDLCYHFVLLLASAFLQLFRFSGRKKRNVR
jgi:hypothetical protein